MSPAEKRSGETRGVLFLTPGFPPKCGSGVQRSLKFVRYLPGLGWNPVVLTRDPANEGEALLDLDMQEEAAGARVIRLKHENPFSWAEGLAHRRSLNRGLLRPLGIAFKYLWAPLPEEPYFWWCRRARRIALRLLEEERPKIIYSSGPPHSVHLLGLWLKRRTGLPLVCDFRDAWSRRPIWAPGGLARRVDRFFERRVLRGADRVICNNAGMQQEFEEIEPACRGKCAVITNGFDPADFEGIEAPARRTEGPTKLAHVGFVTLRAGGALIRGLGELHREEPAATSRLRVSFISGLDANDRQLVDSLGLGETVAVLPRVKHREAARAMVESDVLLLLLEDAPRWRYVHSGKLYEYLASGRPVLAIVPEGAAADLVRESGAGLVLAPGDRAGLLAALRLAAEGPDAFARAHYHPHREVIGRYERRRLTGELAGIFDELAGESTSPLPAGGR